MATPPYDQYIRQWQQTQPTPAPLAQPPTTTQQDLSLTQQGLVVETSLAELVSIVIGNVRKQLQSRFGDAQGSGIDVIPVADIRGGEVTFGILIRMPKESFKDMINRASNGSMQIIDVDETGRVKMRITLLPGIS